MKNVCCRLPNAGSLTKMKIGYFTKIVIQNIAAGFAATGQERKVYKYCIGLRSRPTLIRLKMFGLTSSISCKEGRHLLSNNCQRKSDAFGRLFYQNMPKKWSQACLGDAKQLLTLAVTGLRINYKSIFPWFI